MFTNISSSNISIKDPNTSFSIDTKICDNVINLFSDEVKEKTLIQIQKDMDANGNNEIDTVECAIWLKESIKSNEAFSELAKTYGMQELVGFKIKDITNEELACIVGYAEGAYAKQQEVKKALEEFNNAFKEVVKMFGSGQFGKALDVMKILINRGLNI